MKTAISLPDDVFERAELAAKRLKVSRSEVTAAINAAISEAGQPDDRVISAHGARRVLESEW